MADYRIIKGGMHERFHASRSKIQVLGGGFGNGKTAAVCIKALRLARDYPGCNGLIARSTYPKLNDTIRKEFLKWCPADWIQRRPTKDDNTLILTNGSTINFRYVSQKSNKEGESSTSNLLSATYDWAIVDQMEDPEFTHKDFMDLMGRLRGNTPYVGDDPTMPRTGPRWFMMTLNPTGNWCYTKIVRPLHRYHRGEYDPNLLCEVDNDGKPIMGDDGRPTPIIEIYEGSTHENVHNVGEDYIKSMLATYTGSMRDRFVFGKWGALDGLVYPAYNDTVHELDDHVMQDYYRQLTTGGYEPSIIESYDHGIASPSCYLFGFVDDDGNVFILDGFYEPEQSIETSARSIIGIRTMYDQHDHDEMLIFADPDVFRKKSGDRRNVGRAVSEMFLEENIRMTRGDNSIASGIAKVSQYLAIREFHEHPIYGTTPAPRLFVNRKLEWWRDEITSYYWQRDTSDEKTDKPRDRKDHAMDATKYLLTHRPALAKPVSKLRIPPAVMQWSEIEGQQQQQRRARHR